MISFLSLFKSKNFHWCCEAVLSTMVQSQVNKILSCSLETGMSAPRFVVVGLLDTFAQSHGKERFNVCKGWWFERDGGWRIGRMRRKWCFVKQWFFVTRPLLYPIKSVLEMMSTWGLFHESILRSEAPILSTDMQSRSFWLLQRIMIAFLLIEAVQCPLNNLEC